MMTSPPANPSQRAKLHRVPMLPVAIPLVGGIMVGRYAPLSVGFYGLLAALALVAAVVSFSRRQWRSAGKTCLIVCIASLGAVHVRTSYFSIPNDHIVTVAHPSGALATVRGRIVTSPVLWRDEAKGALGYRRPPRTVFALAADGIEAVEGWRPVSGLVRVSVSEGDSRLRAGQHVEVVCRIGQFAPPANPGQFDWSAAARRRGLLVWATAPTPEAVAILTGRDAGWPLRTLWRLRSAASQHLLACGDGDEGRLINAMVLGQRDPALNRLNEMMIRSGLAHFLSISGLHLGIFLGFVYSLCRLLSLSPRRSAVAVLVVLGVYVLLAEPRAPLMRSAIMAAALCAGVIVRRPYATANSLAVAAVVLLAGDPLRLFDAGFQLSFAIVIALLVFRGPMRRWLFARFLRRRGLTVFRGEHRVRRWLWFSFGNWLTHGASMSLVAYLAAAPLVAHYFGLFTPWAPLLSLLLLPMVTVILIGGYATMALAWPMPNLSHTVGQLTAAVADGLEGVVALLQGLPGLAFELRPVGVWWVIVCYVVLGLIAARRRLNFGRAVVAVAVGVLIAATLWTQRPAPAPAAAELHLLAVGKGQCAVLRTPGGETVLLDVGSQSGTDIANQILRPFLKTMRLPAPSAAFVSHANADHFNALPALLARQRLERVYFNAYFGDDLDLPADADEAELMRLLAEGRVPIVRLTKGMAIDLDSRTRVEVLWPPTEDGNWLDPNDRSLVLRIVCDDRSVLVCGDVQSIGQAGVLAGAVDRCDAMVLPHHGAWQLTLPAFVRAFSPTIVLVSTAQPLSARATSDERQTFYNSLTTRKRLYTTSQNGWIRLRFAEHVLDVRCMRQ
ncbi:MAG: ComEC/Rec2 family competence protein [Planctomycetota bacterium]